MHERSYVLHEASTVVMALSAFSWESEPLDVEVLSTFK